MSPDSVPRSEYDALVRGLHQLKGEIAIERGFMRRAHDLHEALQVAKRALAEIADHPEERNACVLARATLRTLTMLGGCDEQRTDSAGYDR